jgi:Ca2+-binding RTX toxin-like protein
MAIVVALLGAAPAMAAPTDVRVGSDGVLSYDAQPGQANDLAITEANGSATITDAGTGVDSITPGTGCTSVSAFEVQCGAAVDPAFSITSLVVNVRDLDDTVTLNTTLLTHVSGRDGNDTLNGGEGPDVLEGDDGTDTLNGNGGADFLRPDDRVSGLLENDTLAGGPGSDTAVYTTVVAGVTLDLSLTIPQDTGAGTQTLTDIENVNGSRDGPDRLTGNAEPNLLLGSGGDDVLNVTGGGADSVNCGTGTDTAYLDITDTISGTDSCEVDPAPQTEITSGPSGGAVISNPAPEFAFSSTSADLKEFLCRFNGGDWFQCPAVMPSPPSPATFIPDPPLADGAYTLQVIASDQAGNVDQTPASVSFVVDTTVTPGPGDGPPPSPSPEPAPAPNATGTKIVIGSLVLISGNAVKMSRKGRVSISLTCAGASKCTGRLSITTAEPLKKRKKLVTLGAKKFAIGANQKRKVNVKFSKRNIRLAKRLKRFKAKALIREIDNRGNLRLSSRLFTLRAR